jgi:hypothetical protein
MSWLGGHNPKRRDEARLVAVTVPPVVAEYVERHLTPHPTGIRPPVETVTDAELWLRQWTPHPSVTDKAWPSMEERMRVGRLLMLTRWLVDQGRLANRRTP